MKKKKPIHILLVDVNEASIKRMQEAFRNHSKRFHLVIKGSLKEAGNYLLESGPDIVIVNAAQAIKSQNRKDIGKIKVRTFEEHGNVCCEIYDDGPGIPDEIIGKTFDPFFTTNEVGKGTGLGLNISHDIVVNKHKGDLTVESEPGKGCSFTIKLPIEFKKKGDAKETKGVNHAKDISNR